MDCSGGIFDWDKAQTRLAQLNVAVEDPELWSDPAAAQKLLREQTRLKKQIDGIIQLEQTSADLAEMVTLAESEGEAELAADSFRQLQALQQQAATQELETLLSGEADGFDAYLEINSGAGGTESQDWAAMLMRMYLRYGERRGFKVSLVDQQDGDEAGIKSVTLQFSGDNAYGWLKTEAGVHRLVRISPFDSNARRHTSFAAVLVWPATEEDIDIELQEKDLKVDTFRSSGAGGQNVNKVESAVRITHIPSGIIVSSQQERSQLQNRQICLRMIKARLYELELKKREEGITAMQGEKTEIGWGRQIRSYVLHPYQMVKDLRTNVETSDTGGVLDGALDPFINAALAQRVKGELSM